MKEHIEIDYNGLILRGYHQIASKDDVIIITHGIGGNKLGHKYIFRQMADVCQLHGISSMRLDFAGSGESDGKFEELTHFDQIKQVEIIISNAIKKHGYQNVYLCSTTIGCYSIWHAAGLFKEVKAIINWNPITDFQRYYNNALKKANIDGTIDYHGLWVNATYLADLKNLEQIIPSLDVPVLMLQGDLDKEFNFGDAAILCEKRGWQYTKVPNGNHLWDGTDVRNFLFNKTIEFIKEN